jgi:hypothetical protein
MVILAWPMKRLAFARLLAYSDGTEPPPPGAELLVATVERPVQVSFSEPAEMERIVVYATPTRSVFREVTAEDSSVLSETAAVDFRVRIYEPGEYETDADQKLGDMCSAVATALATTPLGGLTRLWLATVTQDPPVRAGAPEPGLVMSATLSFRGEAVAYAG